MTRPFLLALIVCIASIASSQLAAKERTAASLLPASTAIFVEVSQPKELIGEVLEHPLKTRLFELPEAKAVLASDDLASLRVGISVVESTLDMSWRETLETLAGDGAYVAVDAETRGLAVLLKSTDAAKLSKIVKTAVSLGQTASRNGEFQIARAEYRGIEAYKVGEFRFVQLDEWLLIVNNRDLGKGMLDGWIDGQDSSLETSEVFAAALKSRPNDADVWAFADIEPIRQTEQGREFYERKSDNAGIELIAGGLRPALGAASAATAILKLSDSDLSFSTRIPFDRSKSPETHDFFFAPPGDGSRELLHPKNEILSLSAWRDVGRWWLTKEDLFDDKTLAGLSKADSELSTLFAGLDFGQDVLAATGPHVQIVATRPAFDPKAKPDIQLPAAAIVFELKDPDKMQQRLKVAFQSVMGFVNIGSAQEGGPRFDLDIDRADDSLVVSGVPIVEEGREGMIQYNFSPTVAFRNKRFVISSTRDLASELVGMEVSTKQTPNNTVATLKADAALELLKENRGQLIAQNMLENGHSREEAAGEIDILFALVSQFQSVELQLSPEKGGLVLNAKVKFEQK